jgi:hypothetical protein
MNKNDGLRGGKKWYLCAFNGLLWINVALCTCFLTSYPHFEGGLCTFWVWDVGCLNQNSQNGRIFRMKCGVGSGRKRGNRGVSGKNGSEFEDLKMR